MRLPVLAITVLAVMISSSLAAAGSKSRHERIEVRAIKVQGEVVGLKLLMLLRSAPNHDKVRIGLGPNTNTDRDPSPDSRARQKAADLSKGYLLHQWKEIKIENPGQPQRVELVVLFKDNPKLKPGAEVEIISAWNGPIGNFWHVWGLQAYAKDAANLAKIPGDAGLKRRSKITEVRRSGKRSRTTKLHPSKAKHRGVIERLRESMGRRRDKAARQRAAKPKKAKFKPSRIRTRGK